MDTYKCDRCSATMPESDVVRHYGKHSGKFTITNTNPNKKEGYFSLNMEDIPALAENIKNMEGITDERTLTHKLEEIAESMVKR